MVTSYKTPLKPAKSSPTFIQSTSVATMSTQEPEYQLIGLHTRYSSA